MKILAFETSCDDTAIAIVENGTKVLSNIRLTQEEHSTYGGVVPEIAARCHSDNWKGALKKCLNEASLKIEDIDYLAVTKGPGLQASLLTGTTAASIISVSTNKKIIPAHHILGHVCANYLERNLKDICFPGFVLTVSGGHTQMHIWEEATILKTIGGTLDDAAGEAFDKVAKMLGLGYPGGPIVSKYAESGNEERYKLPNIYLSRESLDFSFSGLKSAIYRLVEKEKEETNSNIFSQEFINDICASFQKTVTRVFVKKVTRAIEKYPQIKQIHFVGGVSANTKITQALTQVAQDYKKQFFRPAHIKYSTDNAAMIAAAAYQLWKKDPNIAKIQFIDADSRLKL